MDTALSKSRTAMLSLLRSVAWARTEPKHRSSKPSPGASRRSSCCSPGHFLSSCATTLRTNSAASPAVLHQCSSCLTSHRHSFKALGPGHNVIPRMTLDERVADSRGAAENENPAGRQTAVPILKVVLPENDTSCLRSQQSEFRSRTEEWNEIRTTPGSVQVARVMPNRTQTNFWGSQI